MSDRKRKEGDPDNGIRLVVSGKPGEWYIDIVKINYVHIVRPDNSTVTSSYVEEIAHLDPAHHYTEFFPDIPNPVKLRRDCRTLPEVIGRCKQLSTETGIPMLVSLDKERAKHVKQHEGDDAQA